MRVAPAHALCALLMLALCGCAQFTYEAPGAAGDEAPNLPPQQTDSRPWIVTVAQAEAALAAPGSVLLDAREGASPREGVVQVRWQEFSREPGPEHGLLLDGEALRARLEARGISSQAPVVVVDDPAQGWGEGGRIVWMLRAVGHEGASLLLGGEGALDRLGDTLGARPARPSGEARFTIAPREELLASVAQVEAALRDPQVRLIDTREAREYAGETPYGESRGGHLPGAIHIYFKDLLDEEGTLRDEAELIELLEARGLSPQSRVVAYCTGGIRSAWLVVVLRHLGYAHVSNYAGSMWEWSSRDEAAHPLE